MVPDAVESSQPDITVTAVLEFELNPLWRSVVQIIFICERHSVVLISQQYDAVGLDYPEYYSGPSSRNAMHHYESTVSRLWLCTVVLVRLVSLCVDNSWDD